MYSAFDPTNSISIKLHLVFTFFTESEKRGRQAGRYVGTSVGTGGYGIIFCLHRRNLNKLFENNHYN